MNKQSMNMATSDEGKILALCEFCDKTAPTKYCENCNGSMCSACADEHTKTRVFRNHVIGDLPENEMTRSCYRSGEGESGLSRCPKHLDQELNSFCKNCNCFICEACKAAHKGHAVQSAKDDIQLYHTLCRKHIQGLLDGIHDLNEYNLLIENVFKSYDEAAVIVDGWETQLFEIVKRQAEKLRSELNAEKDKWVKMLGSLKDEATKIRTESDTVIDKLNQVRNVSDCERLSYKLAESQQLLNKLKNFKVKTSTKPKLPEVSDLLPNGSKYRSKIHDARSDIKSVFTMTSFPVLELDHAVGDSSKLAGLLKSLSLKQTIAIPSPKSNRGYVLSRSKPSSSIILHGRSKEKSDIRILNLDNYSLTQPQQHCNVDIFQMVSLAEHIHVAKSNQGNQIHLLDKYFDSISTMHPTFASKGLCWINMTQAILFEQDTNKDAHISVVTIKDNAIDISNKVIIPLPGEAWSIGIHKDGVHAFLGLAGTVYAVNVLTKSCVPHNLYNVSSIESIYVEEDCVFVGDSQGKVLIYDLDFNEKNVVEFTEGLRDMVVSNGKLIVTTRDDKVLVYE